MAIKLIKRKIIGFKEFGNDCIICFGFRAWTNNTCINKGSDYIENVKYEIGCSLHKIDISFATNDIFAENAWYFRNALVRANYTNLQKGIHETTEYLEVFLRNLLLNEEKVDVESVLSEKGSDLSVKTTVHIHRLFKKFGFDEIFGRSAVMEILELKSSGASKLLSNLVQADIIDPVSSHGKGKYKFKK